MNTTVDLYPGVNRTVDTDSGQNGAVHICDHNETASHGRFELSTLAGVDSEELLRELLRRIGEDPDREGLRQSPTRILRSWKELFSGYDQRADDVMIEGKHQCMSCRGVRKRDGKMITSCLLGEFKGTAASRAEFFSLVTA